MAIEQPKQLLVLIGPKGSGKTTLGRMLEQRLGASFVHVERIAQRILAEHGVIDARYERRVLRAVLDELAVQQGELLVIESTGASSQAPGFFSALRERYEVLFVRVHARRATCDARMAERAQSSELSADLLALMYELPNRLALPWDLELDNDVGLDARSVADAVKPLLRA